MTSECQLSGCLCGAAEEFKEFEPTPYPPPRERVMGGTPRILGVIPCRWKSTRFPGKPLAMIGPYPMVWHVYQRVVESEVCHLILVATDDTRILDACVALSIPATLTSQHHETCSDRVAEVAERYPGYDIILNIQGDEPFITPRSIQLVASAVIEGAAVANGCAVTTDPADLIDGSVIKVVMGPDGHAVYLSRSPIPYPQRRTIPYYVQVCVYGFTPESLRWYAQTPVTPQEAVEGIDLNRFMLYGRTVQMVVVDKSPVSVDTPSDLEVAHAYWLKHAAR